MSESPKRSSMLRWVLVALVGLPCVGACGGCAWLLSLRSGVQQRARAHGDAVVAAAEAAHARTGRFPEQVDVAAPENGLHASYALLPDAGYRVTYPEAPLGLMPTDFFYVWDRDEKRWSLKEASEAF